jgi:hypothetical protein
LNPSYSFLRFVITFVYHSPTFNIMATTSPPDELKSVRADINGSTHKALQIRQNRIQEETGSRPLMVEVVSLALHEWAEQQEGK